ncbi:MAG: glycosyltransferase family 9 protein [Sphingomonadaceae bacterium]
MKRCGDGEGRLLLIPFAPGIGDVVMMEPLLRAVCTHLPEWRVTLIGREYASDLLPDGDYEVVSPPYFVSETPTPLRPLDRLIPRRLIAWAAEPAFALDLGPFQRVINLFWVWESQTPFDEWWTPEWPLRRGVRHTVDLLADHLEAELGTSIPPSDRTPRVRLFPEAEEWAAEYHRKSLSPETPVASLVVSASNSLKWWSARKWAELNDRLAETGWATMLIAPQDHLHARDVRAACGSKPLWPRASIRQVAALLARSGVVIGIDTGPLHMASALGVPWVGLFGASNPDLIGPYDRSRGRALVSRFPKPDSCRQCWRAFKNREDRCPTLPTTGCTTMISVQEVLAAVDSLRPGTGIASLRHLGHEIEED